MPFILLLFIVVPLIEIALFIQVGDEIGVLATVALVVFTAALGVLLLRWQGVATLLRARSRMAAGEMPAREMVEGLMLAIAGALLLTPGFFTDAVGFALLVPACRKALFNLVRDRITVQGVAGGRTGPYGGSDGHTFEGEYERADAAKDRDRLSKK
ncbi:FxsA family protein [Gilvimarinus algae]|uniref:FxsA family protein n=1 Tax=Gilvimarinus algae TaxID=3058037 RepID=A0ABT8TCW3_9GAMM|nr:FxsA family protein [Gilvimarinus sp. SDUM040014]MDO3381873.1 FxsA family protein [Gilvimarinus sp. SDUM040014]